MKNNKLNTLIVVLAVLLFAVTAQAQTQPTKTTLSAAMIAGANSMTVTSATGFAATTNGVNNYVLVERDLRRVTAVSGTTITLSLPSGGPPVAHPSGAAVVFGPTGNWNPNTGTSNGAFLQSMPTGTCVRTAQSFLPTFVIVAANPATYSMADCLGGRWLTGTLLGSPGAAPLSAACTVPIGSVAYGSVGTSTTTSSTAQFTASVYVPYSLIATGITNLNGSAVDGASKKVFILYDSTGKVIANTATAGTAATGNDAFQAIAFTATQMVLGPALYFIGLQDDTADVNGVRTIAASTFTNVVASSITSVFGTVAAVTVPTTFTADVGPVACLYQ